MLSVIMLSVIVLSVVVLTIIMLSVIVLSVIVAIVIVLSVIVLKRREVDSYSAYYPITHDESVEAEETDIGYTHRFSLTDFERE